MRSFSAGLLLPLTIIIICCILPVHAVPPLPAEYYGNVLIDGTPAPVGTTITAFLQNTMRGQITTEVNGFYGGPGLFDPRLKVNVSEEELQTGDLLITFLIDGNSASESILFEPGTSEQFDISTGSGSVQVTGPGFTPVPVQTIQFSDNEPSDNFSSSSPASQPGQSSNQIQDNSAGNTPSIRYGLETEESFVSDYGMASVKFNQDTLLFAPSGQFLDEIFLTSRSIDTLPPVEQNPSLVFTGYAYEISPERTYFNPEGVLSFHIPFERISDIISKNPQIFAYNPQVASWKDLKTGSNQFTGEISGTIYEAGVYALFVENASSIVTPAPGQVNHTPSLAPIAGQAPAPAYVQPPLESIPLDFSNPMPPVQPQVVQTINTQVSTPEPVQTWEIVSDPMINDNYTALEQSSEQTPEPMEVVQSSSQKMPDLFSSVKKNLTGPVSIVIALVVLMILINAIAYLIYTRWWLIRENK